MPDIATPDIPVRSITTTPPSIEIGQCERLGEMLDQALSESGTITGLRCILKGKIAGLKSSNDCKFSPETLQRHFDFVFNFLLLSQSLLDPATPEEEKNDYDKEDSARIQHQLSHSILYSTFKTAKDDPLNLTYDVVRNTILRIRNLDKKGTSTLYNHWSGVRNEVAIIRVLLQNGYRVLVPDYNQDPSLVPEHQNGVLELDVRSGVDILAISPNSEIILLNAKGKMDQNTMELLDVKTVNLNDPRQNGCLKESVVNVARKYLGRDLRGVYQGTLVIPTQGMSFVPSTITGPEQTTREGKQKELWDFGRLRPEHAADIITKLKGISHVS